MEAFLWIERHNISKLLKSRQAVAADGVGLQPSQHIEWEPSRLRCIGAKNRAQTLDQVRRFVAPAHDKRRGDVGDHSEVVGDVTKGDICELRVRCIETMPTAIAIEFARVAGYDPIEEASDRFVTERIGVLPQDFPRFARTATEIDKGCEDGIVACRLKNHKSAQTGEFAIAIASPCGLGERVDAGHCPPDNRE